MDKTALVDRYATTPDQRVLYSHLLDQMLRSEQRNVVTVSNFMSEAEAAGAEGLLRAAGCQQVLLFGGYEEAERKCAVFWTDYCDGDAIRESPTLGEMVFAEAKVSAFDAPSADISHRDVLGSLMALGLERDAIGDIVTGGGLAQMVLKASIGDYVAESLTKIGRYPVTVRLCDALALSPHRDFEEGTDTVASMRLDAVVAAVFRLSRGGAGEAVSGGLVSVNGVTVSRTDLTVKAGDKIALRGKGKVVIDAVDGVSKKGRLCFRFRRYR